MRMTRITTTSGQLKELSRLKAQGDNAEWWERLGDVTEVDPEWLLETITNTFHQFIVTETGFRGVPKPPDFRKAEAEGATLLYFVKSTHRDSGVVDTAEVS